MEDYASRLRNHNKCCSIMLQGNSSLIATSIQQKRFFCPQAYTSFQLGHSSQSEWWYFESAKSLLDRYAVGC